MRNGTDGIRTLYPTYYRRVIAFAGIFILAGAFIWIMHERFNVGSPYEFLRQIAPYQAWSLLFMVTGAVMLFTLQFCRLINLRLAISFGLILTFMWAIGILATYIQGTNPNALAVPFVLATTLWGYELATDPLHPMPGSARRVMRDRNV